MQGFCTVVAAHYGDLARGFLAGGVAGMPSAALVVGIVESVPLFVAGPVVPTVYGLLFFLAGVHGAHAGRPSSPAWPSR
ncbi:hypothetical protein [Streptomyces sp. NPDC020780]|uniref:hypothetical protein n=1 Tax=unclassified Streptomyces TaxID=2593676 RepID=UPI0037A9B24A